MLRAKPSAHGLHAFQNTELSTKHISQLECGQVCPGPVASCRCTLPPIRLSERDGREKMLSREQQDRNMCCPHRDAQRLEWRRGKVNLPILIGLQSLESSNQTV